MSDSDVLLTEAILVAILGVALNILKRAVRKRGLDRPGRAGRERSRWEPAAPAPPSVDRENAERPSSRGGPPQAPTSPVS